MVNFVILKESNTVNVASQKIDTTKVQKPQTNSTESTTCPQGDTYGQDTVESRLNQLKKEGCYRPEEKFFFDLITRKAQYTYHSNGQESIAEIKVKFGLKDGAISKCNQNIQDDGWIPPKNYEIFFYEEDTNSKRK